MPKRENLSWEEAIERVLRDRGSAMRYTDIAEQISVLGLKAVANPAGSVAATFSKSLAYTDSPFLRVGDGEYALREQLRVAAEQPEQSAAKENTEAGALQAFGMFWQRDLVSWTGKAKLLGRQTEGASEVNFGEQVGVYLLHDRDRTLYVGRAADTLFARLKSHTNDRLSGRWDRFSWFGLRAVNEDGTMGTPAAAWDHLVVIETLEALLIETMEPPLNRKRGDNFAAVEYLQVSDPEIENRRMKAAFEDFLKYRSS